MKKNFSLIVLALATHVAGATLAADKPNIIIVYADDAGIGDYSVYQDQVGNLDQAQLHTPNLEQLANQGMLLRNAHSAGTVCQPSRFSLLSGIYSFRHPVIGNSSGTEHFLLNPERQTMADMLKAQGYRTGMVGKWHLDSRYTELKTGKETYQYGKIDAHQPIKLGVNDYGFDYAFFTPKGIGGSVMIEQGKLVKRTVEMPYTPPEGLPAWPGHTRWQRSSFINANDNTQFKDPDRVVLGDMVTDISLDFIEQAAIDRQPFFLYMALTAPHAPHLPTEQINGEAMRQGAKNMAGKPITGKQVSRQAMVYETDLILGQVMKQLDRLNIAHNTLIVFTSDNGPGMPGVASNGSLGHGKKQLNGSKGQIYQGGHRIPFVVRWPEKIPAKTESSAVVMQTDLYATLAEITGGSLPKDTQNDSQSMVKLLTTGNDAGWTRQYGYSNKHKYKGGDDVYFRLSMYSQEYSLIISPEYRNGNYIAEELYDLTKDPGEQNNLIKEPSYQKVIKQMLTVFEQENNKITLNNAGVTL